MGVPTWSVAKLTQLCQAHQLPGRLEMQQKTSPLQDSPSWIKNKRKISSLCAHRQDDGHGHAKHAISGGKRGAIFAAARSLAAQWRERNRQKSQKVVRTEPPEES